ncbi:MAG: glycoside hydrolase family 5 protein, partial [Calditrichaeota bacterium]|nr:glycoside hydrolase family 5 protein [Calditrichota bacterium]
HPALKMLPVAEGLGVNIHFYKGNSNDLNMMTEAGIGIVRMDVSWSDAEKEPGKYNFSRHDQLISDLESRGLRLLFILDYGNALYDEGLAPHSEKGRAAYARFAAALAKRYAGKRIIWELWNEPNTDRFWRPKSNVDDYMAWSKTVVPAIRQADPQACIVAPAVSRIDFSFLQACFEQGLLELVDGVSVHPYRSPEHSPETALDEYNLLKLLIDQYRPKGKDIPILSGEWGYNTTVMPRSLQGKYLPRQWLSNMSAGIPISIWYDWHDDGRDANEPEHNFGTVTWDYQPKPAYIAMKTLIQYFQGFQPLDRIGIGEVNDYVVPFIKDDKVKLALWTTGESHTIELGEDLRVTRAVDYLGKPLNVADGQKIIMDDGPRYLALAKPLPLWLDLILEAQQMDADRARACAMAFARNKERSDPYFKKLGDALKSDNERKKNAAQYALSVLAGKLGDSQKALDLYHRILKSDAGLLVKKKALTAVAIIASQRSEPIVEPLLRDTYLSQDAACYFSQLALKYLQKNDFKTAKKLLIYSAKGAKQRYMTEQVLTKMKELGQVVDVKALATQIGFIDSWWVAGPFPNANDRGEKTSYFPEKGIDFSQTQKFDGLIARWQKVRPDNLWGIVPLADLYGRKQEVAYAFARLNMPREMDAVFKIGSNDGVVCWLNGKKVHENFTSRILTIDEDVVPVHLEKGINRILLKVPNKGANWEVCLRVSDQKGAPLNLSGKIK